MHLDSPTIREEVPVRSWRWPDPAPAEVVGGVLTIGMFDGVHRGHQQIISWVGKRAAELAAPAVVVTFEPHPAAVVDPERSPARLTEPAARAELIEALGVDGLCVVPFTPELARWSPQGFVDRVLRHGLRPLLVVVGGNFRFGRRASGDVELLRELGRVGGFRVEEAELLGEDPVVFSSTYVRQQLAEGRVELAARALGRPHRVTGVVVRGDQRGRDLGFPTANLRTGEQVAVPGDGVYAGWAGLDAGRFPAAISVGVNPTFPGQHRRIEAHLMDFAGDLYGQRLTIDFVARLRDLVGFPSVEDLTTQIGRDVADVRQVLLSAG